MNEKTGTSVSFEKEKVIESQFRSVTPLLDTYFGCRVGAVTIYATLHVGCASLPIFAGVTLYAQLPLPGVRHLCLGLWLWLRHLLSHEFLFVRWASRFLWG